MTDRELESALNGLQNVQAMLAHSSYWSLSQLSDGQSLGQHERDAMIGAVEAMGWAVERAVQAWEAEWDAKRAKTAECDKPSADGG